MNSVKHALRLSVALASLAVSIVCLLLACGAMPDATEVMLQGRKDLCEAIAVYSSSAAVRDDREMMEATARAIVARNRTIRSVAIVRSDGKTVVEAGEPLAARGPSPTERSSPEHAHVPICLDGQRWGTVEIRFRSAESARGLPFLTNPSIRFVVLLTAGLFVSNLIYLSIVFRRERTRASGIPERVRATLDTLVEGVLLLDAEHRIALVNESFARTAGQTAIELEGRSAEELAWTTSDADAPPSRLPWDQALERGTLEVGKIIGLRTGANQSRTLSVNATPIVADNGTPQGVLATFDDMTELERKNLHLRTLTENLKRSRDEIRTQNEKLRDLATLDHLTACLNRRAFFERFEPMWEIAVRNSQPLTCVLLDIDHFKSVNDNHGHAVGDEALRVVSGVLRSMIRPGDLVCRYGGEEFCLVFPQTGEEDASAIAERFRLNIAEATFAGISVTSSFGVASRATGASNPLDLINRADQALYAAKRSGRNRVLRYDQIPADLDGPEAATEPALQAAHG